MRLWVEFGITSDFWNYFAKIRRAAGANPILAKFTNITSRINPNLYQQHLHDYLFIIGITK